ncbi:hypothetical protein, partial [Paenibacillus luteus]|uniref:hypothetical protein n=1 Tax=Paenibacillus luteus TaxID=2545753 RepID=UPI0019D5C1EE
LFTTCSFTSNEIGLLFDKAKTPIMVEVEVLFFLLSTMMGAYQYRLVGCFAIFPGAWSFILPNFYHF